MSSARATLPDRAVWFVAQGFRWPGRALPSEQDMREYWQNAVRGGARGIFWYSYGGGAKEWDSVRTDPDHWENVKRVVKELARREEPGR